MSTKPFLLGATFLFIYFSAVAQQTASNAEDSLNGNLSTLLAHTTIGGYGNVLYQRDFNREISTANLERFVLFVGHKFTKQISFFSEVEVEDAKVSGGEEGGEIALEQCYLKFSINQNHSIVAGLFLPRIGIMNENHLPNAFYGNERTQVETFILPSTWREIGVGFYGSLNQLPLNYSVCLVNGLNSAAFEHGSGIREGRYEGRNATANNLALTGALRLNIDHVSMQVSGYYGGTVGLAPQDADSLGLASGMFGTPVIIGEANIQYTANGLSAKVLGTVLSIPDAFAINRAYSNNTAQNEYGMYAEIAYNLFRQIKKFHSQELVLFLRYEMLDMNFAIPVNAIPDETLNQQHIVTGFNYLPAKNVVVKADVRLMHTGKQNAYLATSGSILTGYRQNNTFLNLGIGFSF